MFPVETTLFMPKWKGEIDLDEKLKLYGIDSDIKIVPTSTLHPRWKFWPFVLKYKKQLKSVDLVYTRITKISLILAKSKIPHALEIHDLDSVIRKGQIKRICKYCNEGLIRKIIPISKNAALLLKELGINENNIHVAPSGYSQKIFNQIPLFNADNLDAPQIIHLGRMNEERGKAIFEAVGTCPDITIIIVGGRGCSIKNAENRPVVPLKDVPKHYGMSDIILLPYQPEISTVKTMSPIKLFESIATGRPIIASNLPVISEVLTHEENALLVDPKKPDEWLKAIQRLRKDRLLAEKLAANNLKLAPAYTWKKRAKNILKSVELLEA